MPDFKKMSQVRAAARAFSVLRDSYDLDIIPCPGGLINQTFICRDGDGHRFVLQRINDSVFPDPVVLMDSFVTVCDHLEKSIAGIGETTGFMARVPRPYRAADGGFLHVDAHGGCWRLMRFVPGDIRPRPRTLTEGREMGKGLGRFHRLLADLDCGKLVEVLPGFHRLSHYLDQYDAIVPGGPETVAVSGLRRMVDRFRERYSSLEKEWQAGTLTVQAVHGDPKCDNFIFNSSGCPVSLVDLDTVMAAPLVLDFADCVRSSFREGENGFNQEMYQAVLAGWLGESDTLVSAHDLEFVPMALRCLFFELGLRFFTDHLRGNRYFKTSFPGENLVRAQRQFFLLEAF